MAQAAGMLADGLGRDGDEASGVRLVARALARPTFWIAENAGEKGAVVVSHVGDLKGNEGFNALTLQYEDLLAAGVLTPAKVDRVALQNACSVASLLLTTDSAITEIKEKKDENGVPLDGIPFHPYYSVKDIVGIGVFLIFFSAVVFFAPDFFGLFLEPPNFEPANPLKTPEHIAVKTLVADLEKSFINSGRVTVVASAEERDEIRGERADQQQYASEESAKAWGRERGADYMLIGEINAQFDSEKGKEVKYYQVDCYLVDLETNVKVWTGGTKIKKFVGRSKYKP